MIPEVEKHEFESAIIVGIEVNQFGFALGVNEAEL